MGDIVNLTKYMYPDHDDKVTGKLIADVEPYRNYWAKSESRVLDLMKIKIHENLRSDKRYLLDAGCGEGRLCLEFAPLFSVTYAIDPDPERLRSAKLNVEAQLAKRDIRFECTDIQAVGFPVKFDAILCSHVLQHVPTPQVPAIIEKFAWLLNSGGLLFITASHSVARQDVFCKSYLQDGQFVEERINAKEFNALTQNNEDVLPVHCFTGDSLRKYLNNAGFNVLDWRSFHLDRWFPLIDRLIDREALINSTGFLRERFGRDILFIAQKRR